MSRNEASIVVIDIHHEATRVHANNSPISRLGEVDGEPDGLVDGLGGGKLVGLGVGNLDGLVEGDPDGADDGLVVGLAVHLVFVQT